MASSSVRTALVTGASTGIGREIAAELARHGAAVVLVARSQKQLEEAARAIREETKATVHVLSADLADGASLRGLYERAEALAGPIDCLVNNAGIGSFGPVSDVDWETQEKIIDLNVKALAYLSREAAIRMRKLGGGRILNVASTAAFQAGPGMAVYFASKAFVLSFSEALAEENRPHGIQVSTLCPGATRTEFEVRAQMQSSTLFGQNKTLPSAREVAECGYRGMMAGQEVIIYGALNRTLVGVSKFLPRKLAAKVAAKMIGD